MLDAEMTPVDYTIPSDNRELQPNCVSMSGISNYTIPSDNRELQLRFVFFYFYEIIPYQVITGNYNRFTTGNKTPLIIPYQVITGNYN